MFSATSYFLRQQWSTLARIRGIRFELEQCEAQPVGCPLGSITWVKKRERRLKRWGKNVMISETCG
jgi:hypothetical protein